MEDLQKQIARIVEETFSVNPEVQLTRPEPQFGDYSTNIAMQLARDLGRNPREIATELQKKLIESLGQTVSEVTIAGPGFINLKLKDDELLNTIASQPPVSRKSQTIVIETNNPNPFKAMHVGHGFNAVLGDTIANLLEVSGANLYRVSYHGDVGSHVGKSMYSLLKYAGGDIQKIAAIPVNERNSFMSKMYSEGSKAYKEDPKAKVEIDELAMQSFTREDQIYAEIYEMCKDWSFEQIDELVGRLGNKPIERRFLESDADARGVPIVKANTPKVFQESDGALIFPGSKYGSFDNVFVSSKGLGLYGARDMGLMKLKDEQYHPDFSYIVTAEEQRAYFIGVLEAARQCLPEVKGITVNISTGMVKLPSGKMSSRSGDVVEVAWLFDQVSDAIRARGGSADDKFVAAVLRYQFLKVRIGGDVIFDINEAASIEGNSGPYLQYAHARACSILAKSQTDKKVPAKLETDERMLVAKLTEYHEVVSKASEELMPHIVCTYLYELAQVFNRFYENNRVIDDAREAERLYLVSQYANVLKQGLELLGIHAPESM